MSDQNKENENENEKNSAKREGGFGSNPEKSFEQGKKGGFPKVEEASTQASGGTAGMGNASRTNDKPGPGPTDWQDTPGANDSAGVKEGQDGPSDNTKSGNSEEKGKGWGEPAGPRGGS
ncbi:hypothetical protein BH24BAC1_BH24BAC1_08590 [soil metagenome]